MCSNSNLCLLIGRLLVQISQPTLSLRTKVCNPQACTSVRLLGPCFKTGQAEAFCQQVCVRAWRLKEENPLKEVSTNKMHQTHASKHKSSQTHAIQTPQENYHSCARVIKCTNRNWQAKKESSHPQPTHVVKQAPQSHPAKSSLFTFCSANTNSFNSLFKVLFIFPSWYLCAISLNPIFTFTWNLPPTLHSNAKECDSANIHRAQRIAHDKQDSHPHWRFLSIGWHLHLCW